jgi:hypothetical protein
MAETSPFSLLSAGIYSSFLRKEKKSLFFFKNIFENTCKRGIRDITFAP